jgi:hypothetical protein
LCLRLYELSDIPCAIYTRASDCDMDLPQSDGNNDRNDSLNDGDAVKGGTTSTNTDLSAQDGVSTEQSNEEDDALNEVPELKVGLHPQKKPIPMFTMASRQTKQMTRLVVPKTKT